VCRDVGCGSGGSGNNGCDGCGVCGCGDSCRDDVGGTEADGGAGRLKLEYAGASMAGAGWLAALTGVLVREGEKAEEMLDAGDAGEARIDAAPPVAYRHAWRERSRMAAAAFAAFTRFSASRSELRNRRMLNMEQVLCKKILCKRIRERRSTQTNFRLNIRSPFPFDKKLLLLTIIAFSLIKESVDID